MAHNVLAPYSDTVAMKEITLQDHIHTSWHCREIQGIVSALWSYCTDSASRSQLEELIPEKMPISKSFVEVSITNMRVDTISLQYSSCITLTICRWWTDISITESSIQHIHTYAIPFSMFRWELNNNYSVILHHC